MNVLWQLPKDAVAVVVLAHGAGAGMAHGSMQAIADALERRALGTLRFNFPYMDAGNNRVDSSAVATATIAEAFAQTQRRTRLPVWLSGHSFGGRMASHAVVDQKLDAQGLIFCSFPLHLAGKPAVTRAAHLPSIRQPMLFLSGTRDELAERTLLEETVKKLPTARLHWLETADHGYKILKRTRTSSEDVFDEMARIAREFVDEVQARG